MPPPEAGDAVPEQTQAKPSGTHAIADGPAPAGAAPPAEKQPPQVPFLHSQNEQQPEGVFLSDDQFRNDFLRESHSAPLAVLIVSALLSYLIYGYQAFMASEPGLGLTTAFGTCIVLTLAMGIGSLASTGAGWIICKMFGEDYGSALGLLLRFSAVATAQFPVFALLDFMVGGILSLLLVVPVILVLAMVIGGFDVIRAFLYCVILGVVNWMIVMFLAASFATAVMA
jgi:hypothetical protein